MCSPIRCSTCGKVTWMGCGQHVEEALAPFSADERCTCANESPSCRESRH